MEKPRQKFPDTCGELAEPLENDSHPPTLKLWRDRLRNTKGHKKLHALKNPTQRTGLSGGTEKVNDDLGGLK